MTGVVHIGDAHGRIALWLDEQSARDLADTFGPSDLAYAEILAAVERPYPPPSEHDGLDSTALRI